MSGGLIHYLLFLYFLYFERFINGFCSAGFYLMCFFSQPQSSFWRQLWKNLNASMTIQRTLSCADFADLWLWLFFWATKKRKRKKKELAINWWAYVDLWFWSFFLGLKLEGVSLLLNMNCRKTKKKRGKGRPKLLCFIYFILFYLFVYLGFDLCGTWVF